jgi:mevalonate kinase
VNGKTTFRLERPWNPVEDLQEKEKEKERNKLLEEINTSLKAIETSLQRIEKLFRATLSGAGTGGSGAK